MDIGTPLRRWTIKRIAPNLVESEVIGFLYEHVDFYRFAAKVSNEAGRREAITHDDPQELLSLIKLNYGTKNKFSRGKVEEVF